MMWYGRYFLEKRLLHKQTFQEQISSIRHHRFWVFMLYFARSPKKTWAMAVIVLLMWNVSIQIGGLRYEITSEDAATYYRISRSKDWSWLSISKPQNTSRGIANPYRPAHVRLARALYETTTSGACQPIQVALLVSGQSEIREMSQLMMTILAHRTTPLILHIISDSDTQEVLKTLFDTWELPAVDVNYYVDDEMKPGEEGDMARTNILLNLHTVLNQGTPIIVLRPKMRLNEDIKLIYEEFKKFSNDEILGLRMFYKRNSINLLVRHTSVDLVLVNTKRLQESIISKHAGKLIMTSDDLNSVLVKHLRIVHSLPCSFNLRLEPDSDRENCLEDTIVPKAIWWGPMAKHTFVNSRLELLKEHIEQLVSSDGELFRFTRMACTGGNEPVPKAAPDEPTDDCAEYRIAASLKRRTHKNFLGNRLKKSKDRYDVTMVTQLTMDRWGVLEKILNNWRGPVSVVLYLSDAEAVSLPDKMKLSNAFANRTDIALHVVYKRPRHMAINYLRNLGVSEVGTQYTLMMDVDLVPSPNMYHYIKDMLKKHAKDKSVALVVPALEAFVELPVFPSSKGAVLKLWQDGKVNGFGMIRKWNLGHKPTNFDKWKTAKEPYFVEYQRAFEPYVILPTKTMPKYDERFLDRMADKIIYAQEVFALGHTFKILSDCYVIHLPHPLSQSRIHWETSKTYKPCGFTFMKEVKKELIQRFPGKKIPFT